MGRWDHLYDQKSVPLREFALDKAADELVKELRTFPPPSVDWLDDVERARYGEVLARPSPVPVATIRVACELARLELLREVEVIDRFLRSPRAREYLPDELEERTALFLSRFLIEAALEFQEWTQRKFRRPDLVSLIERVETRCVDGDRLRLMADPS